MNKHRKNSFLIHEIILSYFRSTFALFIKSRVMEADICSKSTAETSKLIKTPAEWRQRRRSAVFIVNFEQISHAVIVFLLLTLN